jgi:uncharacterized protein
VRIVGINSKEFEKCLKKAEQGDAYAQYEIGLTYALGIGVSGIGVSIDYAKAAKWYLLSAKQGNMHAQFNLGEMYASGWGVEQDYEQAAEWFSKAAEQGDAGVKRYLGWMYEHGIYVNQNDAEAVEWYRKAAEQLHLAHKKAKHRLEQLKLALNTVESKIWFDENDLMEVVKGFYEKQ